MALRARYWGYAAQSTSECVSLQSDRNMMSLLAIFPGKFVHLTEYFDCATSGSSCNETTKDCRPLGLDPLQTRNTGR